jgi:surfactin synthase thioesterase subunit
MNTQKYLSREKMTLFCLPFAGGSNHSYRELTSAINHDLHIEVISLPGRGNRIMEPLLRDMTEIVDDVYRVLKSKLQTPYAIYGHSMGTLVGYLVTRKILQAGLPAPLHLFFSGRGGPSVKYDEPLTQHLTKAEFITKLKQLGGSPDEILNDASLMDFFEPILRADFQAVENFSFEVTDPFHIPISVMIGTEEKTTREHAQAWQEVSHLPINLFEFTGKHFFIFDHKIEIMNYVNDKLTNKQYL